jgi:hypothetical protein
MVSSQVPLHLPHVDDSFQRGLRVFFEGGPGHDHPLMLLPHTHMRILKP